MFGSHAIEHGASRPGRWLRERRLRLTLWIAAIEGLLVVVHVLHWWLVVVLAAIAVGIWLYGGRHNRSYMLRQTSWILAVSQLLVVIVPLALAIATTVAIAVFALLAVAALVFLFTERP